MRSLLTAAVLGLAAASACLCGGREALGRPAPAASDVLVFVNGEPLLRSTVDELLAPAMRGDLPRKEIARRRRQAVRELLTEMIIEQFLKKEKFTPTAKEIDAEIARRKSLYESSRAAGPQAYEKALRRAGTSVEVMKKHPTPRMRLSCHVRRHLTEKDILRTYETEKDSWTEVRARHVLISTKSLRTAEEKEAARKKAEDVRLRALSGEDFGKLARELSECPSGKKAGGDLGFFPRHGKMAEAFAAAAFALKKGDTSPVVATQFGYHVIQTTGFRPDRNAPLEEVREKVAAAAADKRGREIYARLVKAAKLTPPGGKK